jgi:hypothetical protein
LVGTAAGNSVVGTVSKQNATFSHQAAKFNDFKPNGVFGRDRSSGDNGRRGSPGAEYDHIDSQAHSFKRS